MTLYRLSEQVALHMEATTENIREGIFKANLACHLDETPWPILSNHDDNGCMWILSNQARSYYRFEPTRSGNIADELLKGYLGGHVLTDKYSGYLHFRDDKKVAWGLCWSHARREFLDLEASYANEVQNVVKLIDDLFDFEHEAKNWNDLRVIRQIKSQEKLENLKELLEDYRAEFFDNDEFCKAINYVLSAWSEFTAFVDHVELDPIAYMKYVIMENQNELAPLTPLERARQLRGLTDG